MKHFSRSIALTLIVSLAPAIAHAQATKPMDHSKMDHGKMGHGEMKESVGNKPVDAKGVINSVDAASGMVNVTHEPVEALGWPQMTMDLPVTKRVDLSKLKTGEPIIMTLKQGRDKRFRITGIKPAQ